LRAAERAPEEEGDGRAQARPPSRVPHHRLARPSSAGRRPGAAHEPARRAAPRPLPALHLPRLLPRPLPRDLRPRGVDRRRDRGGRRGTRLGGEPDDRRVRARAPARAHGGDHRRDGAGARDPAGGAARMTGRIRDEAIRAVRERASLSEVVSDVVALRRRGRSAVGLCPFHAEKTPSFTVSEERGFFHCFGCGEHGDVFAFLMKAQALTFPEAVRRVAERFGIPVPETVGARGRTAEPLVAVNAAAAAFFQAALAGPLGAGARDYVRERGLRDETVRRFGLGYAPGAGDVLARHLRAKNFPL